MYPPTTLATRWHRIPNYIRFIASRGALPWWLRIIRQLYHHVLTTLRGNNISSLCFRYEYYTDSRMQNTPTRALLSHVKRSAKIAMIAHV